MTVLRQIYRAEAVTADGVCAALCGYLLVGLLFGHLFCVAEIALPDLVGCDPAARAREVENEFALCRDMLAPGRPPLSPAAIVWWTGRALARTLAVSIRRRIWNAVRGPSEQIGAVATGHSRRSIVMRCTSRSRRTTGSTRTVAAFS